MFTPPPVEFSNDAVLFVKFSPGLQLRPILIGFTNVLNLARSPCRLVDPAVKTQHDSQKKLPSYKTLRFYVLQ